MGRTSFRVVLTVALGIAALFAPSIAYGWIPTQHTELANMVMNHSTIQPFISYFGLNQSNIASAAWEPSPAETYQWGGWDNAYNSGRNHNGYMLDSDFIALSEEDRIGYILHNCCDNGVPINHAPANHVYTDQSWFNPEWYLEGLDVQPLPSSMPTLYTGTYSQKTAQFYSDQIDLATRFKANHSASDRVWAAAEGYRNGLRLAQAVMLDYFSLKMPEVANANGSYAVSPGGTLNLTSSGSYDPDGDAFTSISWDLTNNGTYDLFGASPTISYYDLVTIYNLQPGSAYTLKLRVIDDDTTTAGIYGEGFDTASLILADATRGDTNYNGLVNIDDLGNLLANYGQSGKSWLNGDFNGDHLVNINDLGDLLANYGYSGGSLTTLGSPVPEPSVLVMLFGLALSALYWRRVLR